MHWEDGPHRSGSSNGLSTPRFHPADVSFIPSDFMKHHHSVKGARLHDPSMHESMIDGSIVYAGSVCQSDRSNMVTPPPSDGSGPRSPPWDMMYHPHLGLDTCGRVPDRARREYYELPADPNDPVQRIDGVRKKNAKFEIPDDHNLENLDGLIAAAPDDFKRKEFKMQKRLLRNREAALHSRQKKKAYTEELEIKVHQLKEIIRGLETDLEASRVRGKNSERRKDDSHSKHAQLEQRARRLQAEKEAQTKENARLRAQVSLLQESLHSAHTSSWSSVPGSAVFPPFGPDIGSSSIDISGWNGGLDFSDDYCLDPNKLQRCGDDAPLKIEATQAE